MCGILAVLGCSDDSQAKRVRVLELSRRQVLNLNLLCIFVFMHFLPLSFRFFMCLITISALEFDETF